MVVAWKQRSRPFWTGLDWLECSPNRSAASKSQGGRRVFGRQVQRRKWGLEDHFEAAARSFGSCSCIRNLIQSSASRLPSLPLLPHPLSSTVASLPPWAAQSAWTPMATTTMSAPSAFPADTSSTAPASPTGSMLAHPLRPLPAEAAPNARP